MQLAYSGQWNLACGPSLTIFIRQLLAQYDNIIMPSFIHGVKVKVEIWRKDIIACSVPRSEGEALLPLGDITKPPFSWQATLPDLSLQIS